MAGFANTRLALESPWLAPFCTVFGVWGPGGRCCLRDGLLSAVIQGCPVPRGFAGVEWYVDGLSLIYRTLR